LRETPIFSISTALLVGFYLTFYHLTFLFSPFILLLAFLYLKKRAFLIFVLTFLFSLLYGNLTFSEKEFSQEEKRQKFVVKILKVEPFYEACKVLAQNKNFEKLEFTSKSACSLRPGQTCELFLKVKKRFLNPYMPSLGERLLVKEIIGEYVHLENLTTFCVEGEASFQEGLRWRLFNFSQGLSPLAKGLFQALVLGVENQLPFEYLETLKSQGLYHQLAISGFNLAILYGLLYKLMRIFLSYTGIVRFGVPLQIWASLFALPGAFLILLLSGFQPPTIRAFFFLIFLLLGKLLFRNTQALLILFLAGAFLVLLSPELVGNISFQLSFVATFALLIGDWLWRSSSFISEAQASQGLGKRCLLNSLYALWLSLLVSLLTSPFILGLSGEIPVATPINNLIAGPFWSFLFIPVSILSALIALISEPLAKFIMELLAQIFSFYIELPLFTLKWSPSIPLNLFYLLLFMGLFIFLLLGKIGPSSRRYICVGLILVLLLYSLLVDMYKQVEYLIVPKFSQNKAFLFKDKESFYLFLWVKEGRSPSRELFPLLKKLGVRRIDKILLWRDTSEANIGLVEEDLRRHFDIGVIYHQEDLALDPTLRLFVPGKEIILLGDNSFLVEFKGLTLQVVRGFLKKEMVMPYVEVLLAERISPSVSHEGVRIFSERERNFALYFVNTEKGLYFFSEEGKRQDPLQRLFFPFFIDLGFVKIKSPIVLKGD